MYPKPLAGIDLPRQKIRELPRGSGKARRYGPSWLLVCVAAAGCVTQTLSETPGPQWQPGTAAPAVGARPAARPAGNKAAGESAATATANQSSQAAANPAPNATTSPTPAASPAKPVEPAVGQLQLLSPSADEGETDRAPRPVKRAEPPLTRGAYPNPPRVRQFYAYAATYAAGRCRFASCATGGWNTPHAEGDSESRCRNGDCLSQGWMTTHPDGSTTETRCRAGSCAQDGWSTTAKDATTARTAESRCLPTGCFTAGWNTTYEYGTTAESRCHESRCLQSGWSTRLPSGDRIECRCSLQDCPRNGAECT